MGSGTSKALSDTTWTYLIPFHGAEQRKVFARQGWKVAQCSDEETKLDHSAPVTVGTQDKLQPLSMGTLPDLLGQAVCLILPVWHAKCNNSQASYSHWHEAFEPEIPHRNPHGCLRWRMTQHVRLVTPGNTARASPSCWDLLWSILATCSSPTMQVNEMKIWHNLELSAQQHGQEQGLDFYYCVHKHAGFMVKTLYWKATSTRL